LSLVGAALVLLVSGGVQFYCPVMPNHVPGLCEDERDESSCIGCCRVQRAGVSASGQRIEAALFQSPRIADRPIACHRLGDDASLSIAFAQSGCVVDGDATP
jgi:hypothetical protein